MRENLVFYSLLSFFSFCFFIFVFQAAADTQTPQQSLSVMPTQVITPGVLESTPTIYFAPTATPTTYFTPTPFIPIATVFPKPTAVETVIYDLEVLFAKYSDEYHADRELLKKIARCESGFNPQLDSGIYVGMFQFASQTWINTRNSMGLDANPDLRRNAEESIRTAAYMISRGRENSWPSCSK